MAVEGGYVSLNHANALLSELMAAGYRSPVASLDAQLMENNR